MLNLGHTPHPLAEDHFHVRELIERQERRVDDRNRHRQREKDRAERDGIIADSKAVVLTEFWCGRCRVDYRRLAYRQVEQDWNADQRIAFYKAKCRRGHWGIRLITDRSRDVFFQRSRLVAQDRGVYAKDILQPFETGYNMVYGKK